MGITGSTQERTEDRTSRRSKIPAMDRRRLARSSHPVVAAIGISFVAPRKGFCSITTRPRATTSV